MEPLILILVIMPILLMAVIPPTNPYIGGEGETGESSGDTPED